MKAPKSDPIPMRDLVVERLVGATGDLRQVTEAARTTAMRSLPVLQDIFQAKFSAPLVLDIAGVEVVRLAELKPEPDSFDALVVIPATDSRDALTMRLDAQALSLLVSILLGGDPDIPPSPLDRPPSRIELDVARLVFGAFAQALNGTGSRSLGLRLPAPQPLAGPGDFKRFLVRDGPGIRIAFSLGAGPVSGILTAWLPHRIILKARAPAAEDDSPAHTQWKQRFGEEVRRSTVQVTATIPLTKLPLGALANLKPGQVLELQENAPRETRLSVRNRPVFVCEFGRLGQNYTVRIRQPFDDRQAVLDGLLGD
ncbi:MULTISPECIES: FliM/FliN family flagellar motor switch protein [Chelativorans]|uniref:Flagellar motor switch protein FliM n=1 Tax=Chelativorans sp. (strain BNC1) TaxID=266779 RepID=Q11LL7_CHESB|nr:MULTISPECIES: FliM/FliN family flagellar motor switch protein [Chelativorans]